MTEDEKDVIRTRANNIQEALFSGRNISNMDFWFLAIYKLTEISEGIYETAYNVGQIG